MKRLLHCGWLALCLAQPVTAADYPSQPVTLVVPSGAGGITDTLARSLAQKLNAELKQPIVVENRPGASGIIGTSYVARANPDGYTLLMAFPSHVVNPSTSRNLPYDTENAFAPVSKVGTVSSLLLVPADSPAQSLQDFIAQARHKPDAMNYGSVGPGSLGDLSMLLFQSTAKVKLMHVPYKSDPQVLTALIQGDLQAAFVSPSSAMPMLRAGKIRALGIADAQRLPALPDVPTLAESGMPGFSVVGWNAIFAPARTPPDIVAKLNAAVNASLRDPDVIEKFEAQGVRPVAGSQDALRVAVHEDIRQIGTALKAAGVDPQ